jgi:hypothetical protein
MKKTGIGIVLMFVLAGSLYVFYALGGFNAIQVSEMNLGEIELSGIHYRGTPQDESLRQSFLEMQRLQKSNEGAILHTIYYTEPAGKLDTMEVFVGIEKRFLPGEIEKITLKLDASKAVIAEIKASRFVMPGPNKVKSKIKDFARSQNKPEPNLFIDQIIGPESVRVISIHQPEKE